MSFSSSSPSAVSSLSSAAISSVKAWIVDVATEIVSSYLDQSSELAIKKERTSESVELSIDQSVLRRKSGASRQSNLKWLFSSGCHIGCFSITVLDPSHLEEVFAAKP